MEEKMKRLEEVVVAAKDAATAANNQALYPIPYGWPYP